MGLKQRMSRSPLVARADQASRMGDQFLQHHVTVRMCRRMVLSGWWIGTSWPSIPLGRWLGGYCRPSTHFHDWRFGGERTAG